MGGFFSKNKKISPQNEESDIVILNKQRWLGLYNKKLVLKHLEIFCKNRLTNDELRQKVHRKMNSSIIQETVSTIWISEFVWNILKLMEDTVELDAKRDFGVKFEDLITSLEALLYSINYTPEKAMEETIKKLLVFSESKTMYIEVGRVQEQCELLVNRI